MENPRLIKHNLEFTEHEISTMEVVLRKSMADLVDLYELISKKTVTEMDDSVKERFNIIRDTTFTLEAVQGKLEKFLASKGSVAYEFPKFKVKELGLTRTKEGDKDGVKKICEEEK